MAIGTCPIRPDAKRDRLAAELDDSTAAWPFVRPLRPLPAGAYFWAVPGSNGNAYIANERFCQCPDYQRSGNICKHIRAVVRREARKASEAGLATDAEISMYQSERQRDRQTVADLVTSARARAASRTYDDLFPDD